MATASSGERKILFTCLATLLLLHQCCAQETVNITGLEVALRTLPFLESLPEKDGRMIYGSHCENKQCAHFTAAYKQSRAWLVLAYLQLYNATGDPKYLDKAREHVDKLILNCDPNTDSECLYIGVQAEAAYNAFKDEKYLAYLKGLRLMLILSNGGTGQSTLNGIMARQRILAYKHGLENNSNEIAMMMKVLNYALDNPNLPAIAQDNGTDLKQTACWTYLAQAEYYRLLDESGDKIFVQTPYDNYSASYLKPDAIRTPRKFFDKFDFQTAQLNEQSYAATLTDFEPCAETLIKLYEATGNERYRLQYKALLTKMLEGYWDSEYTPKYAGDNSFTSQGCRLGSRGYNCYRNNKILTDNAYAVYLFAKAKDETFTVKEGLPVEYKHLPQLDTELNPNAKTTTTEPRRLETSTTQPNWNTIAAIIISITIIIAIIHHTTQRGKKPLT